MDIIIEIGTPEQKQLIEKELGFFVEFTEQVDAQAISLVVIPEDFEKKVNELQETKDYKSERGVSESSVTTMAKTVRLDDSIAIILSSLLYTEYYDSQIRSFVFIHEITHVINHLDFPKVETSSRTTVTYLGNLYRLFDEYWADRLAYQVIDNIYTEKSQLWENYIENEINGFTSLLADRKYYDTIQAEIDALKSHNDTTRFLDNIKQSLDELTISTVHLFVLIHHNPSLISQENLLKSSFVNEKTWALLNYFKSKYEQNDLNLDKGIELITEYMMNFGIRFEDRGSELHCYVTDIQTGD